MKNSFNIKNQMSYSKVPIIVTGGDYCPFCKKDGGLFQYFNQVKGEFYICENCLREMTNAEYLDKMQTFDSKLKSDYDIEAKDEKGCLLGFVLIILFMACAIGGLIYLKMQQP